MDAVVIEGNWLDVTEELRSSVSQLNLGELLKSDHFSLLEAMSAIELMDPKMDSGMMLKQSNKKIFTLDQSIRLGLVKVKQLKAEELIGIIDDTYACLITWFDGNSLSQTVMTNLYLHDPEKIEDRCLKAFCLSILKIVYFIDRLVSLSYCIEEEDFQLDGSRYNLASSQSEQKILSSIEDLCQYYEKQLRDNYRTSGQANNNNAKKLEQDDMKPDYEKPHLVAIIDRLKFTIYFYICFMNLTRFLLKNNLDSETLNDANLSKSIKQFQLFVQKFDSQFELCLDYLDRWSKSINLGINPERTPSPGTYDGDYPTIMGFEPLINYKLMPPSFPRCPSIKTRQETLVCLKDLIIKLRRCVTISVPSNQRSINKSIDHLEEFSKYFSPPSCVVSRAFLQALYLPNRSTKLFKLEIYQSMIDYCEPMVQAMRKDEAKSNALDEFISECHKSFSSAILNYGHNPVRQHERFPELITALKTLQYSALLINSNFNSSIAYSWTTFNIARFGIKYILSGLELEIFSFHEYPYVFWYLYDILYRNEREQLELAKQCIIESQTNSDDAVKKVKNRKQRKKNQSSTQMHDKLIHNNDAFRFLSGGLFLITYGLRIQGKIRSPCLDYTTEQTCFDHRFGILTGTSVYHSYKQTLTRLTNLDFIYREAYDCFSEARILFETIEGGESCLRVCKTNMVVARILASNPESFRDRELEFNFDTHPSFPTVKV